ncbi:MAG TPA: hypothetical protein VFY00_08465 [Arenimonas sp.]|nr:hypothetical protein [Arenimonas sp.]
MGASSFRFGLIIPLLVLAGCASSPVGPSGPAAAAPKASPAELVARVRAAGEHGHELEVQPLRDPQVGDLRLRAQAQEEAGDAKAAFETLAQALSISPDDPGLLQWQAELSLLREDWMQAEALAARSYELGPKLGGLCRRNWATIGHARAMRGATEAADVAHRQVESCIVAPPVRM